MRAPVIRISRLARFSLLVASAVWLSACATVELSPEEKALNESPSVAQIQKNVNASKGRRVRWSGSVIGVENLKEVSQIEILTRMTLSSGRVNEDSATQGRALIRVQGFVEPANYPVDRFVTVVGVVDTIVQKPVGEYVYPYVVIDMESIRLLDKPAPAPVAYPYYVPYYLHHDDPLYDPYGDFIFSPFPMHHRYPYRRH